MELLKPEQKLYIPQKLRGAEGCGHTGYFVGPGGMSTLHETEWAWS